jgi:tRNA(fMet)-specific endonuclease VapC
VKPLYLLDTNIVSYVLKGTPRSIRERFEEETADSIAISAITAAELRYWIAKRPAQTRLRLHIEDFLIRVPTLSWDASVAAVHGELKATLFAMGRPLAELDMQIAAHALALDSTLVTHDAAFRHVPNLRTEDWATPDQSSTSQS